MLLASPAVVLAHGGHGNEFQGGSETTGATGSIKVDAQTAKRLGIKVEPVKRQRQGYFILKPHFLCLRANSHKMGIFEG